MTSASISIALATYNGAEFFDQQLDSLLRQTVRPSEIVITDDRSTDATVAIAEQFARGAPFPVRIVANPERLGYVRNFLKAASLCRGDLIAFCDQDDVWHDRKLEECAARLDRDQALLVHHNARVVTRSGSGIGRLIEPKSPFVDPARPWAFAQGFTQVFRRDLLALIESEAGPGPGLDGTMAHDVVFFFLAACLGRVSFIEDDLADYRQHGQNVFGWAKRITLKRRIRHALEQRGRYYAICAEQARRRMAVTRKARQSSRSAADRQLFAHRERQWQEIETLYAMRSSAYAEGGVADRLRTLATLAGVGGYRPRHGWSFGPGALVADAVLGVVLGRVIDRYGLSVSIPDLALRDRRRTPRAA